MASSGQPLSTPSPLRATDISTIRIGIVRAQWHADIVEALVDGAVGELVRCGMAPERIQQVEVPGSFELPVVAGAWARKGSVDALLCFGVIVRGETPHFDFVAGPVAHGLQQVALATGIPCAFGVLTTNTIEQAWARAGGEHGHKGIEAAQVALQTLHAIQQIGL